MAITHEDIQELKKVFDDRYVLQSDCNEIQDGFNKKFANDDKRIDLILAEQKQMRSETKKRSRHSPTSFLTNFTDEPGSSH